MGSWNAHKLGGYEADKSGDCKLGAHTRELLEARTIVSCGHASSSCCRLRYCRMGSWESELGSQEARKLG
jgi:hypothetical protein